jgi:hypothetical protein
MNSLIKAENFPWLEERKDCNAKPTYKIIARSMSLNGDSIVMLHQAGSDCVVNYYIRNLVTEKKIMEQMDKKEADLLRWVVKSEMIDPLKIIAS